jgi:hypothetical protein
MSRRTERYAEAFVVDPEAGRRQIAEQLGTG